ncbi:MAG: sulfatase-like hydrolase/transferase [Candidatus Aminicenantales bacterium]
MLKNWLQSHKIFSLISFFLAGHLTLGGAIRNEKANVLLVTIDTLRTDRLSCYSDRYLKTANIDRLAQKGIVFERAFAHNPLTLPSHVNIMLGTTPLYHGVSENARSKVSEEFLTLAEFLKANGYMTAAFIGAFPLDSRFGLNQGFDTYDESYPAKSGAAFVYPERRAEKVIENALSWLAGIPAGKKWFCWIHLWDPHAPYWPPEPYATRFKNDPYTGEVAYVDEQVGKLFDFLEKNHLEERTLIILTGDHGEALGEHGEATHGYFAYNSTIWIPLIVAGPGIKQGRQAAYVAHIDLFPTVADYLGLSLPKHLQGASLIPLLEGKRIKERPIYFESLEAHLGRGWAPLRGLIYQQKKFIESPLPELYDLAADFEEKNNLASRENLQPFQEQLRLLKEKWSVPFRPKGQGAITREVREKLRSLGYLAAPAAPAKEVYGPEDDLKTLLPYEQKIDQAILLEEKGKIAESVYLLNEVIKERPDFGKAYDRLAQLYRSQGLKEEALKVMQQGYKTNPRNYALVSGFGILLVQEGRPDQGIKVLIDALTLYDQDPEVYNHLGMAYWMKGMWNESRSAYEKAVFLDPHDGLILNNYATLYLSVGSKTRAKEDFDRAEEMFKKSIAVDPGFPAAYNGLGSVYKLTGRLEEAIVCWEKALELKPDYDYPLFNLGRAYLEKGLKQKALECLKRYLEIKGKGLSPEERREVEELIAKCR